MGRRLPLVSVLFATLLAAACAGPGDGPGSPLASGKADGLGVEVDVVFSPQPSDTSHNARIVELIEGAEESIDIAIYSFSQAEISAALEDAVERGVSVRFIFETANSKDRKLEGQELIDSKSGRLEMAGIDVRYVNKIMHHKLIIVDGPRHEVEAASTARIATGSGNWNAGGARFDENTFFISGSEETALRFQREFDLMWDNSRDLVVDDDPFDFEASTLEITDELIADNDNPDLDVFFTSNNFTATDSTFRVSSRDHVSDQFVAAIESAESSILIATGHLRSRPVAEALMAKAEENPEMDIRVYLDAQEYLSSFSNSLQEEKIENCVAEATTETQERNCLSKGFLFGFNVGNTPGIEVRYKYYAYRWDHSYANQMHHKYMIVDELEVLSGSYNYSDNAEHKSFENVVVMGGEFFRPFVDAFIGNFEEIWRTGRDEGLLDTLLDEVESGDSFPIVFDSMALEQEEVRSLKSTMLAQCPAINSSEFRTNAAAHRFCDPNE